MDSNGEELLAATAVGLGATVSAPVAIGATVGVGLGYGLTYIPVYAGNGQTAFEWWREALGGLFNENTADGKQDEDEGKSALPDNPDDLLDDGYEDVSHPDAADAGHRKFHNPETGDTLRWDKGKSGAPGHRGRDHYHRQNPNATGKENANLDSQNNPVRSGSNKSHLYSGD